MQVSIAPYTDADAPAVAAFLTSAAQRDTTLEPIELSAWRSFVARSFNSNGRDFAIARTGAELVAVLMSARYEDRGQTLRNVRIIVDPARRGAGVASSLIQLVDAQDPSSDVVLQASTMGTWSVAAGLLERRGFEVSSRQLWMSLQRDTPAPAPPAGVNLRAARADDSEDGVWCRLHEEGYADDPDFTPMTAGDCDAARSEPHFGLCFAERGGEVVGFCNSEQFGEQGMINSLVCARSERGRGTGRALLLAGVQDIRSVLPGKVRLNVLSDNTAALALYRSVGFEETDAILTWRRPPPA